MVSTRMYLPLLHAANMQCSLPADLHQPTQDLNAAYYNRIPSLSIGRTGGSGSVLPAPGVPNLFPQLLPPGRRDTHDGLEEDGTTLLLA